MAKHTKRDIALAKQYGFGSKLAENMGSIEKNTKRINRMKSTRQMRG